jgi:hypothetical protein
MKSTLARLLWLEATLAVVAGAALTVTLLWPDWIELTFGIDPDGGSGAAEWIVALSSAAICAACALAARYSLHMRRGLGGARGEI